MPRQEVRQSGGEGEVTHALKLNWVFELPFGQGKRWANQVNGVMDRIIGGWQIHGNMRVQSGRLVDFGNVRMVGFDEKELREDLYKLRIDDNRRVWMLPQAVVDETVKAFSVNATSPTGYGASGAPSGKYFAPANGPDCMETISNDYGDCGVRTLIMRGPMFKEFDISLMKVVPIVGRTRIEFRVEALNVFNSVNYVPVTGHRQHDRQLRGLRFDGDEHGAGRAARYAIYLVTSENGEGSRRRTGPVGQFAWPAFFSCVRKPSP